MTDRKFENRNRGIPGLMLGTDGAEYYIPYVDSNGHLRVSTNLDLTADIEVTGTQVLNRRATATTTGDTILVTVAPSSVLKLYKAILSVDADITGEVILKLGAIEVGGVRNPKSGGQYILTSSFPDYELGVDGADLVVNLPSNTAVTINIGYEVI